MQDLIRYLRSKNLSSQSAASYSKEAQRFSQWATAQNLALSQLRYADILHYIQSKNPPIKQSSHSSSLNALKHYCDYLISQEILSENPAQQIKLKGIKRKTLYHILKKNELESLYKNFLPSPPLEGNEERSPAQQRNKIILGLLIYQGLNTREIEQISEKDLDLRAATLHIHSSRRSASRTLPLEAHQIIDIMEYQYNSRKALLQQRNTNQEQAFLISTGKSSSLHNSLQKLLKKLQQQNPHISSYQQIRASVITYWLKHHNLREVQYRAGHRYISSTEAYLINDIDQLLEDIHKYHPLG